MILDKLAESTKQRVNRLKEATSLKSIKEQAFKQEINTDFPFEKALSKKGLSFICEVKKASPSKGVIVESFPYLNLAKEYEQAGASAISVLTEPEYFLGSDAYLAEIARTVNIPVLRKDFTIDSYQIYEAKVLGASAVLLICALLDTETLSEYIGICDSLGLSALVEAHTAKEVESAIHAGARIIGVNNRDLKTFKVDVNTSIQLRKLVPADILFVSESGITNPDDIERLYNNHTDAVLIGESLMRSANKKDHLNYLRGKTDE